MSMYKDKHGGTDTVTDRKREGREREPSGLIGLSRVYVPPNTL